jgi:omega-amidase
MKTLTIALAQVELEFAEPEKNSLKAKMMIEEASQRGADLILLPELWASGFDLPNCGKYASQLHEGWFAWMRDAAVECQIAVGGSLIEEDQGKFYNTFVFIDSDGNTLGSYRKIHLFQPLGEKDYFTPGNELVSFDFGPTRIGLAICYDLRFPELFRAYAASGVELILLTAEWPEKRIGQWSLLLQARAIENQCYISGVNKTGLSQGFPLGGSSVVVGPMGNNIAQGSNNDELVITEIDLDKVSRIRSWMPVLKDRRADLYKLFFKK